MAHDNFGKDASQAQFILSYELLLLLRWLLEHDEEKLRKMVAKAYGSGLGRELDKIDYTSRELYQPNDMQDNVVEFFSMLENILMEVIHDQVRAKAQRQNLKPSVDKIDGHECDIETVQCSLEKATVKIEHNPHANPKELLFEELLRHWKPTNRTVVN